MNFVFLRFRQVVVGNIQLVECCSNTGIRRAVFCIGLLGILGRFKKHERKKQTF
jgi:hypothetical protein